MGRKVLITFILIISFLFSASSFVFAGSSIPKLKLPYPKGEKRIISQGYNCDGWKSPKCTHKGKDRYAIDFNLPGEQDYGKLVLVAANGTARLREQWCKNKNGKYFLCGYGRRIDTIHTNGYITRYAHLKKFAVKNGKKVKQGEKIGYADNTGLSTGTHLHFALYKRKGYRYIGVKPEPMSGYTNFRAGKKWYISDNEMLGEVKGAKVEKKIWNQKFVSYKLRKINNRVYKVTLNFKNTGNTTWTRNKVSLNIIGGYKGITAKFYHKSWLTRLRPTLLLKNTRPGKIGAFVFYIRLPKKPGKYYPRFRPVRYLGGGRFEWIGKDVGTFPIVVKKKIVPKPTCSISANPSSILKGKYSILKWKSSNATSVSITNIGKVSLSGSKKVYPTSTTTYKMTAKGKGGSAICSVKVKVSVPPPPDTTPPEVSFLDLVSPQKTLSFKIKWQGEDKESGILNYDFGLWNEGEQKCEILLSKTEKTEYEFTGEDKKEYIFCLRATDKTGNQSDWIKSIPILILIKRENIWYVPDDYKTIQEAVDRVNPGDTIIVKDGIYIENVKVNRSLTIQSENGAEKTTVQAENLNDCVFEIKDANYVNIIGFTITGATEGFGICLENANHCNISDNNILASQKGILLDQSNENKLTKNNVEFIFEESLFLKSSKDNEIYLNNFYGGVRFYQKLNSIFGELDSGEEVPQAIVLIEVKKGEFKPNEFDVKSGDIISLALSGTDDSSHSLVFEDETLEKVKIYIGKGETKEVSFVAPKPGDYPFYCDIPGHREAGETGVMHVFESISPPGPVNDSINIWRSPKKITYIYRDQKYTNYLGNYWSDYKEKYPDAKEKNGTGIWDTHYVIDEDNTDYYPLVYSFENYKLK